MMSRVCMAEMSNTSSWHAKKICSSSIFLVLRTTSISRIDQFCSISTFFMAPSSISNTTTTTAFSCDSECKLFSNIELKSLFYNELYRLYLSLQYNFVGMQFGMFLVTYTTIFCLLFTLYSCHYKIKFLNYGDHLSSFIQMHSETSPFAASISVS